MFRVLLISVAVFVLTDKALAHGSESSAPPAQPQADAAPFPVRVSATKKGRLLVDPKGMTLYYFDRDDSGNKSNCDGKCAEKWLPLAADKAAQASGDFTVIVRNDGSRMWAYRYRPLYTSNDDKAPGDTNGLDAQNLWHIARPAN
jgi:predicted lipoprotein with Yx(FWY)xxD motif